MTVQQLPLESVEPAPDLRKQHPVLGLVARRAGWGVISIAVVSIIVYWSTQVLPGNAAVAILGQRATPQALAALDQKLHLNEPVVSGYWHWLSGLLTGNSGTSLVNGLGVAQQVMPRLVNSAVLVATTVVISSVIGIAIGIIAARYRDSLFDHSISVVSLTASALPEFVVSVFVVFILSVGVFRLFPAVSALGLNQQIWDQPSKVVLPVLALVIVVTPYVIRMTRAAMIEALNSEYVEVARLKGLPSRLILLRHALPNAISPIIAVLGLNTLYLAGGIVLVEAVFNYPGIGLALVNAVNDRDIPVIQFIVLLLAIFYVALNILTDVAVLLATPRRRVRG